MAKEYTRVVDPFSMGMELGQIFWLTFFPIEEYLDLALEDGAIWGQDYTWDAVINQVMGDDVPNVIGTPSEDQTPEDESQTAATE